MTYSAGLNAFTVVWIAKDSRKPHRAALDHLNAISTAEHNFFGVQIELYRIGGSAFAPRFSVVAKPNDWSKAVTATAGEAGARTPLHQTWIDYWSSFFTHAERTTGIVKNRTAPREGWCRLIPLQSGEASAAIWAHRPKGQVRALLWLQGERNKEVFDQLFARRTEIETAYGSPLAWSRMDDKKSAMIVVNGSASENGDEEREFDWLLKHTTRLSDALRPILATPLSGE